MNIQMLQGDCLDVLRTLPDDSVDLVFTSPPYEDCRTYGIGFNLKGQAWVDWAVVRYLECVRVCRGLVAWVVAGKTKQFRWSATPALLMADLHRAGVKLRTPPIYHRVGICGSGGPDWWRNDYEFVICSSKGRLPWSDNTATGRPPKYGPGGVPSHRLTDGQRANVDRMKELKQAGLSQREAARQAGVDFKTASNGVDDNGTKTERTYIPPERANPGNSVEETYTAGEVAAMCAEGGDYVHCVVGGGNMGSPIAHENEAPFPESLVEPFVKCFCPPGGVVLDPFSGSGTTAKVALKLGRGAIVIDVRESEIEKTSRRILEVSPQLHRGIAA